MRISLVLLAGVLACGSSTEPGQQQQKAKAVDPAISIHLVNQLDATTALGQSAFNVFALIYSPADPAKNGVALVTVPGPGRGGCISFQADSIGARYVVILGLADTVHRTGFSQDPQIVANAWYGGNHTLPAGWAAVVSDSTDWGVSTQFNQGHGLTLDDPIRWALTWTSPHAANRTEAATDSTCHA